jgi:hypothetical protein
MPTVWNTHLERQTLDHLVNTAIMLLDTELSDSSSSFSDDMDVSFDTVLDLLDDDDYDDDDSMDSDNESTIGAAIKQLVEYGTMIYGEAQGEKRVYGSWFRTGYVSRLGFGNNPILFSKTTPFYRCKLLPVDVR